MLRLLLLFTLVPLLELWLLIEIGTRIGPWPTVFIVAATGLIGVFLAKTQGLAVIRRLFRDLEQGVLPGEAIFDGAFILLGAVFLITPGLITDTFGFLFLVPPSRHFLKHAARRFITRQIERGTLLLWWRR